MKSLLLLSFSFLLFFVSYAQPLCGFDAVHKKRMEIDTVYANTVRKNEASIRRWMSNRVQQSQGARVNGYDPGTGVYTIPVVVHVLHTGGAIGSTYNPTDANIIGAINYLNQVYAGTYSNLEPTVGNSTPVNMKLQFALAQKTVSCGYTSGIERMDASSLPNYVANGVGTGGVADGTLKDFARWDPSKYYNIYVVNKINGQDGTVGTFTAGYAYFPGSGNLDGTVMLATQMISGQKTLPHEIGHAFSLYHPFEGSNLNTDCLPPDPTHARCGTEGDYVCDTDPISYNINASQTIDFSCRTGTNSCTGTPYTKNTEDNFMNYTVCYKLFTEGQRDRIVAALTGAASRQSLVASDALIPCGTVVNFGTGTDSHAETGATTAGCRSYTDYTYQMSIGAAPNATATATLTLGGTATQGLDYDVTTNGDFSNPSTTLTFNSGATASQSFTVRIYDDATVESTETIALGFTLNNGGGNASTGTTFPTLTISITDNDKAPVAASDQTQTIGAASFQQTQAPFDAGASNQKTQFIYKASELIATGLTAGNIVSFALNVSLKATTGSFSNFTIKMANVPFNYLVDGAQTSVATNPTTVYSTSAYSTTGGWNTFTLSTPFAWDGVSSVVVEICHDAVTGTGADKVFYYLDGGAAGQASFGYNNSYNCSSSFNAFSYFTSPGGFKPEAQFRVVVTPTPVETVASSNAMQYISNGSNDYFYSNNNALMLRLSGISANLGCVTATLPQAGSTWQAFSSGQRSAKVFAVTPTTNGSTASYTASFYFTNAELGGYAAGTLRLAKTSAASVAAANSSNTVIIANPTITTLGTNTIFTGSFTGFSQFFLINSSVLLPVTLTDFTGRPNGDGNTLLNWTTSSEINNKLFEVQASRDGAVFSTIGTVQSNGNSSTPQHYSFLHVKPQVGLTYYRLKQVDIDGKFTYSNILAVSITDNSRPIITLFPVPAHNTVNINFGNSISKAAITVYSADMKLLRIENINSATTLKEINIANLPNGVYFVKVSDGSQTTVLKFIKE